MSPINTLQSLELILEDVSAEINLSINALDSYAHAPDKPRKLDKSLSHMGRLKGIFTLLEMPGAQRLLVDAIAVIKGLAKRRNQRPLLEAVSISLASLMRYIEHVSHKDVAIPQLLLPSINELRSVVKAPQLSEATFFECDPTLQRENKPPAFLTTDESAAKSRYFRKMFQIGLIEVIRNTNRSGGLNMMQKALQKLDDECPRPNSPNLWWIGSTMLEGFISQQLALTHSRLKILSRLDRQIRKVENKKEDLLDSNRRDTHLLTHEMLYLVSICENDLPSVVSLKAHFGIAESPVTDKILQQEHKELRGPSAQDYHSIADALFDEIEGISKLIQHTSENPYTQSELEQALKQMSNLNSLLRLLKIDEHIVRLDVAIDMLEKAINGSQKLLRKDFNILSIVLKSINDAVESSDLLKYSGKGVSKKRLSPSLTKVCHKAHSQVKQLINDFISFNQNEQNKQLLKHAPELLEKINQGFRQLNIDQSEPIIEGCQGFIKTILPKDSPPVTQESVALFADIIGGLEFYLETLNHTAEPSSGILDFANNSLAQLESHSHSS